MAYDLNLKELDLSIRNDVLAIILNWKRFDDGSNRIFRVDSTFPQNNSNNERWIDRREREEQIYHRIYFKETMIAHYHPHLHLLELDKNAANRHPQSVIDFVSKIIEKLFDQYIPNIKVVVMDNSSICTYLPQEASLPVKQSPQSRMRKFADSLAV